eukprot:590732-Pyramimonas_sp.AAC.1
MKGVPGALAGGHSDETCRRRESIKATGQRRRQTAQIQRGSTTSAGQSTTHSGGGLLRRPLGGGVLCLAPSWA